MTPRPLRQDAARRREDILRAAHEVFSTQGLDAPLEAIAERAGVGRATLYRNFPERKQLAIAVLVDEMERLADWTRAQGEGPEVFFAFLDQLNDMLARNAGLRDVLHSERSPEALAPLRRALIRAGAEPLARAQAAGLVRPDLQPDDIRVLAAVLGASFPGVADEEHARMDERRRALVLDGLRVRP
ncbi:TetR/AcrR family transcriptional regulator [Caulobacter sp. 17J65-9]|uniref:TetR/AcrR family transcriptional regulator n=1 Tax=Caulobacter sp. 17J65-9 TaxID=2709382 RepID=UPI0013C8CA5D|nr:TetR/AcrR family transcriptional regulator [Caulobacter sp. 17J65-9]NEX94368.1 TetR/AcrR family transcriptional regulator [Caulobacter sp. 17J65-9]